MPPKSSSKKDHIAWLLCERCKVHLASKDRDKHEEDCPIPNETSTSCKYSFIQSKKFHTQHLCEIDQSLPILSDELLTDLDAKYLNNLIFASDTVMNLCEWVISDYVVIRPTGEGKFIPIVRKVWPVTDRNTSNVFVTDDGKFIV